MLTDPPSRMPLTPDRRRQLRRRCTQIVPGFAALTPAEEFRAMAAWCEAHGVEHDHYGQGELLQSFERKIAALLGMEDAVFMPSGVMAQLTAVRLWTEIAKVDRFGVHPTSHLLIHEEQAYAALLHCHAVPIGDWPRPLLASDLEACRQPLACAIVELPIREAGVQLPSWDELEALKAAARRRSVRLHMDGARLWESAAHYQRSHAEIAAGFDSVYVSVYKGIGALSGAVLAGDAEFVANARLWRRRMGGTLVHMSPMVVSAAMRFDERLALMPALHARTLELAAGLRDLPAFRVEPALPHASMFHLYVEGAADAVMDARDALAEATGCWLFDGVRGADVPGWSVTEFSAGDRSLRLDLAQVFAAYRQLGDRLRTAPGPRVPNLSA